MEDNRMDETLEAQETEAETTADVDGAEDTRTREELLAEVQRLTAESEDYKGRYLRAQADFDNFRRRSRQEKEEFAAYANTRIIEELLPVLDTFEMAMQSADKADVQTLLTGVDMVYRQLQTALGNYGLAAIESVGQAFDPNVHEGVMQVDSPDHPAGTVVMEMRKGYKLKDKVIRPAMVQVSQ
ncbi:nucleotide exchange factor GrpE [Tumebacillus sp. ITR2]|uniref:Protein GrpE n=1 Tax=Tumebacillus amylolyticus TaxID=2801339 RepID=A0ABS1JDP5_9BACL|nr:nucleotide exchange factor GrpE [Tumebacillus amylolyticus]MBL0388368.1 nucleotide exchange factor GrpE [Tumebacillus amylolyticus]